MKQHVKDYWSKKNYQGPRTLHYTRTYKQNTLALQKVYNNYRLDSSQPKKVGLQRRSRIFSVVGIL